MNFNYQFGFNGQYFLYSKELIKQMEEYGKFYQPPFPDFYTANMMMLVAEKVLVIPQDLVIVGITPKSFGYYHQNKIDEEGMVFHKDADFRSYAPLFIRDKLLNIDETTTAECATLALIVEKFPNRSDLVLSEEAYYKRAIKKIIECHEKEEVLDLLNKELFNRVDISMKKTLTIFAQK